VRAASPVFLLVGLAVCASLWESASAAPIVCRDGNAPSATRYGRKLLAACDVDAACNGSCTFEIARPNHCPECGSPPHASIVVPLSASRRARLVEVFDNSRVVLVCKAARKSCARLSDRATPDAEGDAERPTETTKVDPADPVNVGDLPAPPEREDLNDRFWSQRPLSGQR
jgi:hypothetical protein